MRGVLAPVLSVGEVKSCAPERPADVDGAGEAARDRGNGFDDAAANALLRSSGSPNVLESTLSSFFFWRSRSLSDFPCFFFPALSPPMRGLPGDVEGADAPLSFGAASAS